jgi:hypothetical protein
MRIAVPLIIDIDIPDDRLPALAHRAGLIPPECGQDSWYRRFVRMRVLGLVNGSPEWADDPGANARLSIDRPPVPRPALTPPAPGPHPWALTAHP